MGWGRGTDEGQAGAERGHRSAAPDALPPELAFVPAEVVAPALLRRAAAAAARLGLSPERVLLAEGVLSAELYYRLLASHLGLPTAERPLRPAPKATLEAVLHLGLMPLAGNPNGWTALAAPSGALLRRLLAARAAGQTTAGLALTTPERLEALIRHERRVEVAHAASHGLPDWNRALSARNGLTNRQGLWLAGAVAALGCAAVLAPAACAAALTLLFSAGFLLAIGVRLAATAASPPPRDTTRPAAGDDRDLPLYSVVVPLFREAREVGRLTAALSRLDYPVLGSKHT